MHCNGAQNVQPNHTYSLILSSSAGSGPSQATSINSIQNFAKQHVRRLIFLSLPLTDPHQASSYLYHHLCYISDTIPALGWVVIAPHPAKVGKICKYVKCKMQNAKCKMQLCKIQNANLIAPNPAKVSKIFWGHPVHVQ